MRKDRAAKAPETGNKQNRISEGTSITGEIKSEGDFEAARDLVENYGVKVDQDVHKEVLERNKKFKSAPYSGFINPVLVPEMDDNGEIKTIKVTQPENFEEQMMMYSKNYGFLPEEN